LQLDLLPWRNRTYQIDQVIFASNHLMIHFEYHVVLLQTCLRRWSAGIYSLHPRPLYTIQSESQCIGRLERLHQLHSQVAATHASMFEQLLHDPLDQVGRNAERYTTAVAVVGGNCSVDADDLSPQIDQRSPTRAGVDRCI